MKKIFLIIGLLFSVCAFAQIDKVLPDKKNPPRLYNDFTKGENFLTPEQGQALENKLVAYDDSTSSQVAIVVVESLNNREANEYATALGRKWGIGGKEFSNGILILISTGGGDGNRDAYIAVGYGLEGAIPDMTAAYIVDHEIIENFKAGNYYRGLDEAVDAIIKAAAGEYKAAEGYSKKNKGISIGRIILIVFIVWMILGVFGRGGKGGGGYASRRGYRGLGGPFWWGAGTGMFGGGGGGGGWSGGGGGGGGFGGFGGGGFGGGGAGGKW
jgi:uncharacterized protein